MRAILLVKTSSLGDVIHNLPAATDVRARFPDARLDWAVEEAYAPLVRLHAGVDRVIPVAIRRWRRALVQRATWHEVGALRAALKGHPYDAVIDTQGLAKSALVASLARGPRYGFDRASAREPIATRFYDRTFHVARAQHATARCRQLVAAALGYAVGAPLDYGLALPNAPDASRRVVLLHGTARSEKAWPESAWCELAAALAARGYAPVLLSGTDAETARSARIAAAATGAQVLAPLALDALAAELARATAVVGVDTGLLHLAVALRVPALAIFVATDPALTGPVGAGRIRVLAGAGTVPGTADALAAFEALVA
jgi:heptosyltransferase I